MSTTTFTPQDAGRTLNVLYLEDNPRDRELVESKLKSGGLVCKFLHVCTKSEFEKALHTATFDLVLSDFSLPGYNGDAALAATREHQPDAPFLFVSGTIGEEVAVESLKSGATDYILKGHLQRLVPAVRRALGEAAEHRCRRQAQQDLRASEERLRDQAKLLDMARDAIVVKDADDRVVSWNQGAEKLFGWNSAEVLGRKVTDFLYPDPRMFETIKERLLADGDWSGELRQLTHTGKEVIVSSRATLMCDDRGYPKSILVINTDVTEKKELEAKFLRAQRMESIGTLAGGIAHDLNNILAPISIAAQILRMNPMDKETEEMVDRIEASAHRGADVVRQVLTFARGIEGERALLQPRHLIKEVIKIAQDTFPKSIAVSYSVSEDLWPITGDATQLHQVLLNLFVNARDAMPNGGKLRCTAENLLVEDVAHLLPGSNAGPYLLLQINDTGTGIPAGLMEKIFEPFFTTKELGKGTGLGLSTVLGIVKSHGGSVNVYSEPGQGTSFKIYLPATPSAVSPQVPAARTALPPGHGELILLVDDEAPIRDVIRKILIRHGYNVLVAVDGVEGLTVFAQQKGKIHLVLTDMMMPRMEGVALIQAIRKIDPKIKIIATSGLANVADQTERAAQLKELGVTEFLAKPCTAGKLLNAIYQGLA